MKSPPPSTSCRGKQKGLGLKSKRASIWFVFLAHVSSEHCVTGLFFYTAGKDHLEIRQIWGARVVVLWVKLLPAMSASHMSANLNLSYSASNSVTLCLGEGRRCRSPKPFHNLATGLKVNVCHSFIYLKARWGLCCGTVI